VKKSVQGSVLVDVKCLLVPQIFNVDGFSRVEAEPFTQLFHLVVEEVDLLLTAIDTLGVLLNFPVKHTHTANQLQYHTAIMSIIAASTTGKLVCK